MKFSKLNKYKCMALSTVMFTPFAFAQTAPAGAPDFSGVTANMSVDFVKVGLVVLAVAVGSIIMKVTIKGCQKVQSQIR